MLRTPLCALIFLLHGCIDTHTSEDDDDATPRADGAVSGADPAMDAGAPADAQPAAAQPADAQPADAQPALTACEEAIAWARAGGIEPQACTPLPDDCHAPVNPCCDVFFRCEDGQIVRQVTCDDSCAQGCSTYTEGDCALDPTCAWFDSGACGPGREGTIEGPICAPRPLDDCGANGACPEGQYCARFLIDPCAGQNCDACAGEVMYCVR